MRRQGRRRARYPLGDGGMKIGPVESLDSPPLHHSAAYEMGHVSKTTPLLEVICHPFGKT